MIVPVLILLALLAGSLVYCALTVAAARRYRMQKMPLPGDPPPISILKPLMGLEDGLRENLRSFFLQDYPDFEILMAVRNAADPAVALVQRLQQEYPDVRSRLLFTGEPPYPNAKVFSLDTMKAAAQHEILAMSDSDIRVDAGFLRTIAAEFEDSGVGLITCPYRAVPGRSFWTTLEAIGINTEFFGGVLTARMLEGMKFALGPTIAARREVLDRMGGFERLKDYLAEDFVMGAWAAELGYRVVLSSYVIDHHIGSQSLAANLKHRIRWNRSTRRSRPKGYAGQVFTNPLPIALLLCAVEPGWWPALFVTAVFRAASAWAVAGSVLRDPLTRRLWWLIPLQDLLGFTIWIAGFFGNTIVWRGHKYYLLPDGTFRPVKPGGRAA